MSDIDSVRYVYLHNYLHLVGISIFYYDYLCTFTNEFERIWKRPKSRGHILFFINRYLTFFGDIAVNVGNFYDFKSDRSCKRYALYRQLLLVIVQVIVCICLCIRTYALYRRDRRILALVVGSGLVLLGLACFAVTGQKQSLDLSGGCHTAASRISGIHLAVAWEALFVYDVLIFSLTLYNSYKERHLHSLLEEKSIISVIYRDGAMYFAVMASVNLANTLTFYVLQPLLRGVLSTLASSVSVTMMSRLMLNLHEIASPHMTPVTDPSTDNSTTLLFTSRFGGVPGDTTRAEYSPDALELADPQTDLDDMPETVELEMRDMGVMTTRR